MISLKVGLGCVAGALLVWAGWWSRGVETRIVDRPITVIDTKTNTVTQKVDHVVTKTVVVHVTDPATPGTDTTTTTTTADTTVTKDVTKDKVATVPVGADVAQRDYSVGVKWQPDWRDRTWVPSGADVGYRVVAGAWVTAGYDWKNKGATIGVRVDF